MFALIETNGATHIAINIPLAGADKSLPALLAMLESNATFIQKSWREIKTVKPEMTVTLGNSVKVEDAEQEVIVITGSGNVISDEFAIASAEVFASNKKGIEAKDKEIQSLRTKLQYVESELASLKERLTAAAEEIGAEG